MHIVSILWTLSVPCISKTVASYDSAFTEDEAFESMVQRSLPLSRVGQSGCVEVQGDGTLTRCAQAKRVQGAQAVHPSIFRRLRNAHESYLQTEKRPETVRSDASPVSLIETQPAVMELSNLRDTQYVGPLRVGTPPVTLRVVCDTGSTNMWFVDKNCDSPGCLSSPNHYSFEDSTTAEPAFSNVTVEIEFGTGSLKGIMAKDDIEFGPYKVKGQVFGRILKETGSVFLENPFDGISGLGFPNMAATNYTPLFDSLIQQDQLTPPQFTFYLRSNPDEYSAIILGPIDKRITEGESLNVPVIMPHYWMTKVKHVKFDGKEVPGMPEHMIVDSGTTLFTGPKKFVKSLLQRAGESSCSDLSKMGDIEVTLEGHDGEDVVLKLPPHVYMTHSEDDSDVCVPGFWDLYVPAPYGPTLVFGELFLRNYAATFTRESEHGPASMTFVQSKDNDVFQKNLKEMGAHDHLDPSFGVFRSTDMA